MILIMIAIKRSGMKSIGGKTSIVRQVNRDLILSALKALDGALVVDLARETGLSVATSSVLIKELVESGDALILSSESQGGRPARRYIYNVNQSLVAAIMLRTAGSMAEIRYSVRNEAGESLADGLVEAFPVFSMDILDNLLARLFQEHANIKAVALSLPGVLRSGGEVELSDIVGVAGLNLERHVADKFGVRTISENNMNLAAMGYYYHNREASAAGLVYTVFHRDQLPGMGIVVNGSLIKGKSGFGGEVWAIPPFGQKAGGKQKGREIERRLNHMATVAISAIAIINPSILVITGHLATPDLYEPLRARCLEWIGEYHLPHFIIRPEYEEDSFAGMTALAFGTFAGDVKLVEKEKSWSGPD